jgi:malate dehydrogenase
MVQAILRDEKRIVPCSAYLEGEYGLRDLCFGVPVKLGEGGIEAIMEVELTAEEQAAVQVSAEAVHKSIASLGL